MLQNLYAKQLQLNNNALLLIPLFQIPLTLIILFIANKQQIEQIQKRIEQIIF